MCIDWNLTFSGISTFSALFAVCVAYRELNQWKKIRNSELAEEIIEQADAMIGIIGWARFPTEAEGFSSMGDLGNKEDTKRNAAIVIERLQKRNDILKKCFSLGARAKLHLKEKGTETKQDLRELYDLAQNIYNCAEALALGSYDAELTKTIWTNDENDAISQKAKEIAGRIRSKMEGLI